MAAAPPPVFTVRQAMALCGLNDVQQWNRQTAAQRIASEVFADDFSLVMVKSPTELNDEFNHFWQNYIGTGFDLVTLLTHYLVFYVEQSY